MSNNENNQGVKSESEHSSDIYQNNTKNTLFITVSYPPDDPIFTNKHIIVKPGDGISMQYLGLSKVKNDQQ